jgi:hypothetical protein
MRRRWRRIWTSIRCRPAIPAGSTTKAVTVRPSCCCTALPRQQGGLAGNGQAADAAFPPDHSRPARLGRVLARGRCQLQRRCPGRAAAGLRANVGAAALRAGRPFDGRRDCRRLCRRASGARQPSWRWSIRSASSTRKTRLPATRWPARTRSCSTTAPVCPRHRAGLRETARPARPLRRCADQAQPGGSRFIESTRSTSCASRRNTSPCRTGWASSPCRCWACGAVTTRSSISRRWTACAMA